MALYRKYRSATFAEVIGQQHVTEPLMQALESGRINHAYLFSGPSEAGKHWSVISGLINSRLRGLRPGFGCDTSYFLNGDQLIRPVAGY